jgi:choline-phosphate cytidylyltransferase
METKRPKSSKLSLNDKVQKDSIEQIACRLPNDFQAKLIAEFQRRTKEGKRLRIYTDGWWDMFHYGHARLLEQIKKVYHNVEIVVGVCSSDDISHHSGVCVMSDEERLDSLRHCRWVDEVIHPAPWTPTIEFLNTIEADFIANSLSNSQRDISQIIYQEAIQAGRFLPMLRTKHISASDILIRVLKNKDDYIERNLKKGYTREQLNMGLLDYLLFKTRSASGRIAKGASRAENGRA